MRAVGLIVEYNPFHNGHSYHLQQSRKLSGADAVVAVMSGHFLQRGEPAMADKWTRTRMALEGGCDLVIELPVAYATQAAEWFAYGAVALLEATGVVDSFCFGTESGRLEPLLLAARLAAHEPLRFKESLRRLLDTGMSYPAAYSRTISAMLAEQGEEEAARFPFDQPNHTLGLHYLIAHRRIGSRMTPLTIAREKAQYNQQTISDASIASATSIRKLLLEGGTLSDAAPFMPASTRRLLEEGWRAGGGPVGWDDYMDALLHAILTRTPAELAQLREISEGLEHRLAGRLPLLRSRRFEELLGLLKTKRYTRTKLQRALLSVLLGHAKSDFTPDKLASGVQYLRVLGFTDKGRTLLKTMRDTAALPVLLSAARPPAPYRYLELDAAASGVYMLGASRRRNDASAAPLELYRDYYGKPVML